MSFVSQSRSTDDKIKDLVYTITNTNAGTQRVIGQREYQREFVYWTYGSAEEQRTFPNRVLVYNYREPSWSIFRDNVTFFGPFQESGGITWDSLTTFWDDYDVYWDDFDLQAFFPFTISGNQQGYIHLYNQTTIDEPSLTITAVDRSATPVVLTSPNHNLESGDIIYWNTAYFVDDATGAVVANTLDNAIYEVQRINANTFSLAKWDTTNELWVEDFSYTPANGTGSYRGGEASLLPRLQVITKDFNPFLDQGRQAKFVKATFTTDTTSQAAFTVNTYSDTSADAQGNATLQSNVPTSAVATFDTPNSLYAAHGFYALTTGQYVRLEFTWDDALMADLTTQQSAWFLNNYTLWFRPGGKLVF